MKLEQIIVLAIYVALIVGWILGLVKFFQCDFTAPYKAEIIYGLGIVSGYNCIVGWFNLGK